MSRARLRRMAEAIRDHLFAELEHRAPTVYDFAFNSLACKLDALAGWRERRPSEPTRAEMCELVGHVPEAPPYCYCGGS